MLIKGASKLEFLAKGKRSEVYKAFYKKKEVAIKVFKTTDPKIRAKKEAYFISLLNKKNIGPKLIFQKDNYIIYKLIEGPRFVDWLEQRNKKEIIQMILKIIKICYEIDKLKINKLELQNPKKHILIENNNPILIDFEKCYKTNRPKNLTQFCQYITSKQIQIILNRKGIEINKDNLIKLLREYKKNINSNIKNILNYVKNS